MRCVIELNLALFLGHPIRYSLLHRRLCGTLVDWGAVIGLHLDKALCCAVMQWLSICFKETLLDRFLIAYHIGLNG